MKDKNEAIRFLMSVAKSGNGHGCGFAIAYPDQHGELRSVNEYGEPLSNVPDGMTVIQARDKAQADTCVWLYEVMGDSIIVGDADDKTQGNSQPLMKLTNGLSILM